MTDDDKALVAELRINDKEIYLPVLGKSADRIEQLGREKAVVSDLWEQQKEIALDYLADCHQAADRIEALSAENERLRDALENIVNNCGECGGYGTYPAEETATGKVLWRDCPSPQCHSARVALGETE